MTRLFVRALGIVAMGVVLAACRVGEGATPQTKDVKQTELTIFAASSLVDTFLEIGPAFEAQNPNIKVLFNFASSSALALQLSEGAKADVFASANQKQMDIAVQSGRIDGEPRLFASNRLIAITQIDNPAGIKTLADFANPDIKLVLAAPGVPARDYAEEMLDKLATDPTYGPDFKATVLANLTSEEANVRQVLAKVAFGEADAGIVYSSDVIPEIQGGILRIEIPDEFNVVAGYPIAAVKDTQNAEIAQSFIDFALSESGQAILQKWGFGSVTR